MNGEPGVRSVKLVDLCAAQEQSPKILLKEEIDSAVKMRAAVAYWTVRDLVMFPSLTNLLSQQGSFLCVDFRLPTDIKRVARMVECGADVSINLIKSDWKGGRDDPPEIYGYGLHEPRQLMHSKLLLFDRDDGTAMIWVGSHNWTKAALSGLNIETSAIIHVEQKCPLYRRVEQTLDSTRDICHPFELEDVDFYLQLQGYPDLDEVRIIEVEGRYPHRLQGQPIVVFTTENRPALAAPGGEVVFLSITDPNNPTEEVFYCMRVTQSGQLRAANQNTSGTLPPSARYTVLRKDRLPELVLDKKAPESMLDKAYGFITFDVLFRLPPGTRTIPLLRSKAWRRLSMSEWNDHPVLRRVSSKDLEEFGKRRALLKVPTPQAREEMRRIESLEERRTRFWVNQRERNSMIVRRLIRPEGIKAKALRTLD